MILHQQQKWILSNSCENTCSYCPQMGAKTLFNEQRLSSLQNTAPGSSVTLACNSLFSPLLSKTLNECLQKNIFVNMEINLSTASLPRWSEVLLSLKNSRLSLILIIDKWHAQKISSLEKLDSMISEYRVLPSKLYPTELYQRELPVFVLKKLRWSYMAPANSDSPFFSADEIYQKFSSAPQTLELEKLSKTQSYTSEPLSAVTIGNCVWLSTSETPLSSDLKSTLDTLAHEFSNNSIFYFTGNQDRKLRKQIQKNRLSSKKQFYFLDHSLIPKKIWHYYLSSAFSITKDHFSWNQFIEFTDIQVLELPSLTASNPRNFSDVSRICQQHFARHPTPEFYEEFFCFFSKTPSSRRWTLTGLQIFYQILALLPSKHLQKFKIAFTAFCNTISNRHFEVVEATRTVNKFFLKTAHKTYWSAHRLYWKMSELYWSELYWKASDYFWMASDYFWIAADGFWWCYKHIISPATGFLRSLGQFPPHYKQLSFVERCKLSSLFVLKKIAWLGLKILGKR